MLMSEQKSHRFRPPLYHTKTASGPVTRTAAAGRGESAKEQEGWDAYRKWLTHVSRKPAVPRSPIDHSIYSWKGYQNWADKVRQSWKPEES
jgi:hypothetical protein